MNKSPTYPAPRTARWPIERRWLLTRHSTAHNESLTVTTPLLRDIQILALLGTAGSGKTTELRQLAQLERVAGRNVKECRVAEYSGSVDELRRRLDILSDKADENTSIHLDSLDEAMVPLRRAWSVIALWIEERIQPVGASVRITCRSAVWPVGLAGRFAPGGELANTGTALLLPLDTDSIFLAAQSAGLDGKDFLERVRRFRADALAASPLTLELLFRLDHRGDFPTNLSELFDRGVRTLATDCYERFELDTSLHMSPDDILRAAESLAVAVLLTGRETIDLSNAPPSNYLALSELELLPCGTSASLDRATLAAIGASGLCDSEFPATFRFTHKQLSEYLAGRRLARMLLHQSRGLLASPVGASAGVAGPLRETAAFAAIGNDGIAEWIAVTDPEIVGLSDVADTRLRRIATLGLLDRCKRGELTDAQLRRGGMTLDGLRYEGAELDLRQALSERGTNCEDVLECGIELIETWKLSSMSGELADLMLDPKAPTQARQSAGYALVAIGTDDAKARTKTLLIAGADDVALELKGLALRCNWPSRLTTLELLETLTPRPKSNYHGAYYNFLWQLERSGFNADGFAVEGLRWARPYIEQKEHFDPLRRIAERVVHQAVTRIDAPEVAVAFVDFMIWCASRHIIPPLGSIGRPGFEDARGKPDLPAALENNREARRQLIGALASSSVTMPDLWWLAIRTPHLCTLDDFSWLLDQACAADRPMAQRENYLHIASSLPWSADETCFEAWLIARETDPVGRVLAFPLSVELDSREAKKMRESWILMREPDSPAEPALLEPPPHERVLRSVELAETKDHRYFFNLCREMTLGPASRSYGFQRILVRSPGWLSASGPVRLRIVEAAKRFLSLETEAPESCRSQPLNSILGGGVAAIWLLRDEEPEWLANQSREWWRRWCWYILRELHPHMHDEPNGPKLAVLSMLQRFAPEAVRAELILLASNAHLESTSLMSSLLELIESLPDEKLDRELCERLASKRIQSNCIRTVAEFAIRRAPAPALAACMSILATAGPATEDNPSVEVAVAMLNQRISESWEHVVKFIQRHPEHGGLVLASFAHGERSRPASDDSLDALTQLDACQLGEFASLLLQYFPPESDPDYEGAHPVGPNDSARRMRNQVLALLGDREDQAGVEALRDLERRFGARYPWLRRPRARAERARRLSQWLPLSLEVIRDVLQSTDYRLIRSEDDVLEGICASISAYEMRLHQEGGETIEELWNTPGGQPPSPKAEEHVSTKVGGAVRRYFEDFALAADREVEIRRRTVPKTAGGEPGSELDVLVQVPARGTLGGSQIRVPIEVKLSHNSEVKTAMKAQLADRYMSQLGAMHGVYVVAWMSAPAGSGLASTHKPRWLSIEEARADLNRQASELAKSQGVTIAPIVIDASLR